MWLWNFELIFSVHSTRHQIKRTKMNVEAGEKKGIFIGLLFGRIRCSAKRCKWNADANGYGTEKRRWHKTWSCNAYRCENWILRLSLRRKLSSLNMVLSKWCLRVDFFAFFTLQSKKKHIEIECTLVAPKKLPATFGTHSMLVEKFPQRIVFQCLRLLHMSNCLCWAVCMCSNWLLSDWNGVR